MAVVSKRCQRCQESQSRNCLLLFIVRHSQIFLCDDPTYSENQTNRFPLHFKRIGFTVLKEWVGATLRFECEWLRLFLLFRPQPKHRGIYIQWRLFCRQGIVQNQIAFDGLDGFAWGVFNDHVILLYHATILIAAPNRQLRQWKRRSLTSCSFAFASEVFLNAFFSPLLVSQNFLDSFKMSR